MSIAEWLRFYLFFDIFIGNELMKNKEYEKASKIFDEILMIDAKHINSLK